jgi:hypothetical protein
VKFSGNAEGFRYFVSFLAGCEIDGDVELRSD